MQSTKKAIIGISILFAVTVIATYVDLHHIVKEINAEPVE